MGVLAALVGLRRARSRSSPFPPGLPVYAWIIRSLHGFSSQSHKGICDAAIKNWWGRRDHSLSTEPQALAPCGPAW